MEERTDNEHIESLQKMINKEKKISNNDATFIGKPTVNNTHNKSLEIKGNDSSAADIIVSNEKPSINIAFANTVVSTHNRYQKKDCRLEKSSSRGPQEIKIQVGGLVCILTRTTCSTKCRMQRAVVTMQDL